MRLLVTGGLGFLGNHFVRHVLASRPEACLTILDALTYAGHPANLLGLPEDRCTFHRGDVLDRALAASLLPRVDAVVHFAAESHVTRSETAPDLFHRTNVQGTRTLLEEAARAGVPRFLHVSTDEVYGEVLAGWRREEEKPPGVHPEGNLYARSKSLADDLALSFADRLHVVVVRPTNGFGPRQSPEKAVPRWILRALAGEPLPVWGDGSQVRDWLFAEDCARAVLTVLERGQRGLAYNVGASRDPEVSNREMAGRVLACAGLGPELIETVPDPRPHHDRRYGVDTSRLRALGWQATADLDAALKSTFQWYRDHPHWWEGMRPAMEALYAPRESLAGGRA